MTETLVVPDNEIVFADTEGNDLLPGLTNMWLIQLAVGIDGVVEAFADQPGYRPISEALAILKAAPKVVFHNGFGYDLFALNKLYPGTMVRGQIIDTLVISRLRNSVATRHSLHDIGEELGIKKGSHSDFSQFSPEMVTYGIQDVRILQEAWRGKGRLPPFRDFYNEYRAACELEFYVAYVMQKQNNFGFRFDYEGAQMLESEFRQESLDHERSLQEIFPPIVTERWSDKTGKRLKDSVEIFNPGSRDQISDRLIAKYGWKPDAKTPTGKAKIDETILDDLPYEEAKAIARYMKLGKKLGMISDGANSWLKLARAYPDGSYRMHGSINPLGARTHRMSHFKPNVAQTDKDPRMRNKFLADMGWHLVGVDAEGLELRELAHFLYPYDNGRYVEIVHSGDKSKGTDIHTMNRGAAGLFLRDSAKTMIYAHNYGCFDKKLGIIVSDDLKLIITALESDEPTEAQLKIVKEVKGKVSLDEAKSMLKAVKSLTKTGSILRSKIEVGIVGLGELINKCKRTHKNFGAMPGHDKRWIPSASDHSALNTLLQGNGSIVMKKAIEVFDREMEQLQLLDKIGYCANVHDEYQITAHPDVSTKVAEVGKWAITRAGELLELRCPLVGDANIGLNWAETH